MNQSGKYIPRLAELTHPLRELLSKKNAWVWSPRQQHAFNAIKEKPSSTPALAIFDPALETSLSADASSYGLGAVMIRKQNNGNCKPVIFISRALTATEIKGDKPRLKKRPLPLPGLVRYWQIILSESVSFHMETDLKPLVPVQSLVQSTWKKCHHGSNDSVCAC